jgi:hypothetical protein
MRQKNRDHLAIFPELECQWVLIVPSDAKLCSAQSSEILEICGDIFDSFNGFITPTAIDYNLFLFSENIPIPTSRTETNDKLELLEQKLEIDSGIEYIDLFDSAQYSENHTRWIPFIDFSRNRILVRLEDGGHNIDRNGLCLAYRRGQQTDREPMSDPLKLNIWHVPVDDNQTHNSAFEFQISVQIYSDIWFEDSAIGEMNRDLLTAFFERLMETLDVAEVRRSSNRYAVSELNSIF